MRYFQRMTGLLGIPGIALLLLAMLLCLCAGVLALVVLLSFSIAWYERANTAPGQDGRYSMAWAARLLLAEFSCLLLTLLLRPCGWLPTRLPAGPGRWPPVILLHGLFQNRSCLLPLYWRLRAAGYDRVVSLNTPSWLDLATLHARIRQTVTQLCVASGSPRVHLVGHSMGGLLARQYAQSPEGTSRVACCVTLGSPHLGSKLAPFAISRLGRALLPGSALLNWLNNQPLPAGVHFTAVYSRHDNMIVPADYARLAGATNIELSGLGHTAMLFSPRTAAAVVAALKDSET
jgi:triacylglycerol esterase/lipase EstA (alpha/beta hydrolase family)